MDKIVPLHKIIASPINVFKFRARTLNVLKIAGINTIRDLVKLDEFEIKQYKNSGGNHTK